MLPAELLPLRENPTLQSIDANACPAEAHTGPRPATTIRKAYDAHQAAERQCKPRSRFQNNSKPAERQ